MKHSPVLGLRNCSPRPARCGRNLSLVTGMRTSEAVAIEIEKHIEPDCSIIYVRQQREKDVNALRLDLKTEAGLRDIDLHPDAAQILRNFIGNRTSGFLFQTANGTMLDPGNIDRDSLSPILETMGRDEAGTRFNVFRRALSSSLPSEGHHLVLMRQRYGEDVAIFENRDSALSSSSDDGNRNEAGAYRR